MLYLLSERPSTVPLPINVWYISYNAAYRICTTHADGQKEREIAEMYRKADMYRNIRPSAERVVIILRAPVSETVELIYNITAWTSASVNAQHVHLLLTDEQARTTTSNVYISNNSSASTGHSRVLVMHALLVTCRAILILFLS